MSAHVGEVHGLKAIYRMFLWDEPRFLFNRQDSKDCQVEEQLPHAIKFIIQEGAELRKRYEALRRELPPDELRLQLEPTALHSGTALSPNEFFTLASVVEFEKIAAVVDYNPLCDVAIYESLIHLRPE